MNFSRALIPLVVATMLAGGGAAQAQQRQRASREPVTLNFANAEIEAVARTMGAITGRNVVVDPRVKGTMSLSTERPVTPQAAFNQFVATLRLSGFTVVESAGLYKVVPEADAKLQGGAVSVAPAPAAPGISTQIFRLNYETANNLVPILRPLITPNNTINVNPGNNSLVITDYSDNLQRIGRIIAALDVSNATDVEIVPLKNALASDLAPVVQRLVDSGGGAAGTPAAAQGQADTSFRTTVIAEPRANALIVRAANPARLNLARSIAERLDQPGSQNPMGSIYVVYLKNADAVRLATTLRAAMASLPTVSATGTTQLTGAGGAVQASSAQPVNTINTTGVGTSGTTGTSALAAAAAQPAAAVSTGGQIQADPATNSLIITAPEPQYRQLRAVIDRLDSRRAQVFVESLIVEVNADKAAEFGFQWQNLFGNRGDRTLPFAGTNFGSGGSNIIGLQLGAAAGNVTPPGGFNIGVVRNIGGTYVLGALARFLETNADANILSTPNLLTLDNEEARIVIGQNVPFVTGQFTNTGATNGSVNPFQTIERKDVGITLRVRPTISENGTVKMQIFQEASSVQANTLNSTTGLITNKRSIESNVLVDDGSVIVLGGLLQDEYGGNQEKVPGLGDVPVLGNLFKSEGRSRRKTNLMVFLRPIVLRDAPQSDELSLDRYDLMRLKQEAAQPTSSVVVPINSAPVLPTPTQRPPAPAVSPPPPLGGNPTVPIAPPPAAATTPPVTPPATVTPLPPATPARTLMPARYPLPYSFARSHQLLLEEDAGAFTLWHAARAAPGAWSEVMRKFPVRSLQQLDAGALAQRISAAYAQGESSAATIVSEVQNDADLSRMMQELPAVEDLLETSDDAPIIRMLNALLTQAARDGASDIHIEPYERHSSVRFRVDGTLREVVQPNRALHAALISRLKIMADLDIAEKRLPQDGRISLRIGTRAVDVRVSTLPSAHGERAVLRLLDKSESKLSLESVGMTGDTLRRFLGLVGQPHGIILVTGPTGSGKTTTLYAALSRLDAGSSNIMTVEDPIEYELPGIGQTQVNPKIDLDFAKALRAILRQDPDIIMIGEIRDYETAQIAIQASLTGHLVLATLHTNDAASAVTRLTDMGVEPFLLSSSILGVLAQRLVRKLCPVCRGAGCGECGQSGYQGRTGVFELMLADDKIRALVHNRAAESEIREAALAGGMRLMREDGERLVREGITSAEEVVRVTRD